ncbi:hypothetical protein [Flavobacterium sp. 123]|uniref:hypothetical protein n=1 Tax=Flavobacterium sp. 123 TaxID=2135627 RepID=UPI000EB48485|nr:hypothetical protein [Flavobacterium sp. 123]RKT00172.1 hypothetical protein C8C88_1991 [Flavobacterium sp. 123]
METIELTRKELYDIVWSTTLSKLTQQYAYTNDGIKKLCKQYEVPMPDGSYWSKLKFNKKFKKEKLNPVFAVVDKIVLTIRKEGNQINVDQTPLTIRTKEIESDPKAPLIVPEKLTKPDILIQNTKSYHQSRKNKDFVRNDKLDTVHIYVEEANYNRALNIMDSFIKLLRHRGHSFRRDINNYGPKIVAYDVEFSWNIREKTKRILSDKIYETATYIPTGILILQIGESFRAKEWVDGATKLENRLSKVVAKIELDALKELEWREECRLSDIRRAEEERIRKIFEARKEKEVVKTRKLFSDAKKFDKATMYRNFIKATEQKAITENNLTAELKDWIKWAYDKADWIDPTSAKQDELLNDNDIDEIENPKKTNYYFR